MQQDMFNFNENTPAGVYGRNSSKRQSANQDNLESTLVDASHSQFTDIGGNLNNYRNTYIIIGRVESGRNDDIINKRRSDRAAAISVLGYFMIIGMLFYIMYVLFYSVYYRNTHRSLRCKLP